MSPSSYGISRNVPLNNAADFLQKWTFQNTCLLDHSAQGVFVMVVERLRMCFARNICTGSSK